MKLIILGLTLVFVYAGTGWGENASLKNLEGVSNNGYIEVVNVEEKSDDPGGDVFLNISYQISKRI